jgi:hypothetical protein
MSAEKKALIFKAWAQQNNLISREFPVKLSEVQEEQDQILDSMHSFAASENLLRARHITSIGFNEDENQVIVFTSKKIPIRDEKFLPKELPEGVGIRYIHGGTAHANFPSTGMGNNGYHVNVNGKYTCGSSIHPAKHIGAGTLGCLVKDSAGIFFGLTNNHVSGICNYALFGEKILAPGHIDIESNGIDPFTIGYHAKSMEMIPGVPDNVNPAGNSDAALIRLSNPSLVSSNQWNYYDTPALVSALTPNLTVEKVGRTTGHTQGTVLGKMAGPFPVTYNVPNVGVQISYFDPVFVVQGQPNSPFSQPGDSGSLVVTTIGTERHAVGIVFAGDQAGLSYLLPLEPILTKLDVTLVSGH